ncbi:MAG: hypothetical protein AAF517_08155, partial [Planctomycetota bacterium]
LETSEDIDPEPRGAAIEALAAVAPDDPRVREAAVKASTHTDRWLRFCAESSIEKLDSDTDTESEPESDTDR